MPFAAVFVGLLLNCEAVATVSEGLVVQRGGGDLLPLLGVKGGCGLLVEGDDEPAARPACALYLAQ